MNAARRIHNEIYVHIESKLLLLLKIELCSEWTVLSAKNIFNVIAHFCVNMAFVYFDIAVRAVQFQATSAVLQVSDAYGLSPRPRLRKPLSHRDLSCSFRLIRHSWARERPTRSTDKHAYERGVEDDLNAATTYRQKARRRWRPRRNTRGKGRSRLTKTFARLLKLRLLIRMKQKLKIEKWSSLFFVRYEKYLKEIIENVKSEPYSTKNHAVKKIFFLTQNAKKLLRRLAKVM